MGVALRPKPHEPRRLLLAVVRAALGFTVMLDQPFRSML